jgi:hypothetical protein
MACTLYTTLCLPIRTHRGQIATGMRLQEAYKEKKGLYRMLVSICSLWAQMPRRQGAYGYMGCVMREILGTNFLVA